MITGSGYFVVPNDVYDIRMSVYARAVYLYLRRRANSRGVSWPSLATIARDNDISRASAQRGINELVELGLITKANRRDSDGNEWQSNVYTITGGMLCENIPYAPTEHTLCSHRAYPMLSQSNEVLHIEGQPTEGLKTEALRPNITKVKFDEASEPYQLAQHLRAAILMRDSGTKVPDETPQALQRWAIEADRMVRLDKRDPAEAARLMTWCQQDSFWSANVLSMPTFRRQYDKLKRRAEEERTPTPRRRQESYLEASLRKDGLL